MSSYEISKSSLLSLKAEILRKQEELTKAKLDNVEKIRSIKKKALEIKNKGVEERQLKDLDSEEQDLLKLSRSKLETKSKLYEKLSGNSQDEDTNRRYLVRFDKKQKIQDEPKFDENDVPDLPVDSEEEETHHSDYYDEDVDPADEWVEFTDCFGRSRKCLRKDLEYIKSQDADLKLSAEKRNQSNHNEDVQAETVNLCDNNEISEQARPLNPADEEQEMISGDMRREMLRKQWEKEEDELKNKTDIHYQNVLFNEARQHGVGYYGFSKDEAERAKQQEALRKLRIETEQQQKKAQNLKELREKQMAARMKAARNRKRARLGLPPEEDEPSPTVTTKEPEDEKKKEEENKKQETEKVLAEARKRYVRPWDIGKEGVTEFYQMTQKEWNEKKRKERPSEFAPPSSYNKREFRSMKSLERDIEDGDKSLKFSSKVHKTTSVKKQKLRNINPYKSSSIPEDKDFDCPMNGPSNSDDNSSNDCLMADYIQSEAFVIGKSNMYEPDHPTSEAEDDSMLDDDQTSQKATNEVEPVPIRNEVGVTDFEDALLADYHKMGENAIPNKEEKARGKGVEIAPPPTFEYFASTKSKKTGNSSERINISDSIEAGLKFLRKQAERKSRRQDDIF